ncbi:hypothetical protein, partial [Klebsiella pneumoniae]|uniref:hypothetical protein n=1 Tax=Klebsiella pneumoniae TaxID=573 RepID=UPI001C8F62D5
SPFSNPLVCVVKKDLSIRLCLDARALNAKLINNRQSTEKVDDILQTFSGKKWFSVVDLSMGFWQCLVEPESRKYLAWIQVFLNKLNKFIIRF